MGGFHCEALSPHSRYTATQWLECALCGPLYFWPFKLGASPIKETSPAKAFKCLAAKYTYSGLNHIQDKKVEFPAPRVVTCTFIMEPAPKQAILAQLATANHFQWCVHRGTELCGNISGKSVWNKPPCPNTLPQIMTLTNCSVHTFLKAVQCLPTHASSFRPVLPFSYLS